MVKDGEKSLCVGAFMYCKICAYVCVMAKQEGSIRSVLLSLVEWVVVKGERGVRGGRASLKLRTHVVTCSR